MPNEPLQQEAKEVIALQDACNSSGVVFRLAEAMQKICEEANRLGEGTEWKNKHPILLMYVSKLDSLAYGFGDVYGFDRSYHICQILAGDYQPVSEAHPFFETQSLYVGRQPKVVIE
jgi:hypothetical protein